MTRQILCLVFIVGTLGASFAQGENMQRQSTFEVATVKPSAPLDMTKIAADAQNGKMPRMGQHLSTGRAEYTYMALNELIAIAYDVKTFQIQGPTWLATQRFDIVAKFPEGSSKADAPAMLQQLLAERFKLTVHRDIREQKAYALVVYKHPPNLKVADTPSEAEVNATSTQGQTVPDDAEQPVHVSTSPDGTITINMGKKGVIKEKIDMATQTMHFESSRITMAGFADTLTRVLQTSGSSKWQVVDETGLSGNYQVAIDISLSDLMSAAGAHIPGGGTGEFGSDPGGGSTVFVSVERLGLKLEPRKARLEQLIVDSVEKAPTEN